MVGVKEQTLLMLETEYILALGVNTMPADAVAPKVARPTRNIGMKISINMPMA